MQPDGFPTAAVTLYHELSGSKQHKVLPPSSRGQTSEAHVPGGRCKGLVGLCALGGSRGASFLLAPACILWLESP